LTPAVDAAEIDDFVDVPIATLVPGDIVHLSAGDMIPADVRLLTAKDFFINQAALTGESMPVERHAASAAGNLAAPLDLPNLCFMGTNVVSGFATAMVIDTGARTLFGQLAERSAELRVVR
jgi:P-type Mg2+ transporter